MTSSLSGLGIGLSLVFGCLLLALVAELYYLLWWKKRITNREIEDDSYSNNPKVLFQFSCFKKPSSTLQPNTNTNNNTSSEDNVTNPDANESDLELGSGKDLLLKADYYGEEGVESELMRLHNLAGPPRFLFTIKEETKEDLESEDGKSKRGSRTKSLSDLILAVDNTFLTTPLASPPLKSSSPSNPLDSYKHHGFNPLFESSTESEMNRLRSSPPPKFKFLRDAEDKLLKRLAEEADKKASSNSGTHQNQESNSTIGAEEDNSGSFIRLIVGKNQRELHSSSNLPQFPSSSSKVLPLASSPLGH